MLQWDLGLQGVAALLLLSLGFGVIAQLVFWGRDARWVGVISATAFFVVGLFVSEVWFGWAAQAELQPNIDGLSLDEVLLIYLVGIPVVLLARFLTRTTTHASGTAPVHR
jgi:hypothetical protein